MGDREYLRAGDRDRLLGGGERDLLLGGDLVGLLPGERECRRGDLRLGDRLLKWKMMRLRRDSYD